MNAASSPARRAPSSELAAGGWKPQPPREQRRKRLAELRQQAGEEHRHLRVAEVADHALAEGSVAFADAELRSSSADRPQESMDAEIDEERGACELESHERRLERDDQCGDAEARRERPHRLPCGDPERREDPG